MCFLHPFVQMQTNGPPINDQGFSTGSCNRHHALSGRAVDPATSPVPPFLLAQNPSSKRIAPTDNMRPNSDDVKRIRRLKAFRCFISLVASCLQYLSFFCFRYLNVCLGDECRGIKNVGKFYISWRLCQS